MCHRDGRSWRARRATSQPLIRTAFVLLWASETAFDLGAAMMGFALGVWLFQQTGSAAQFTGAVIATALPALALAPLAGALADRFDRRWVIAGCDATALLMIGSLAVLIAQDRLAAHQIYVFNAAMAALNALRTPAYRAAFSQLVPAHQLTRASGIVGLTQSLLQSAAPAIAGYVMGAVHGGLGVLVGIEVVLLTGGGLAAFGALSRSHQAIRAVADGGGGSSVHRIVHGIVDSTASALRYLRATPGMAGMAAYVALQEALVILATSLLTPLVLSTHASDDLGVILGCGGLGALVGSLAMVVMPVPQRLAVWVLACDACLALFVMLAGVVTTTFGWSVCAFLALLVGSVSTACASALWMGKTPRVRRGSIFALVGAFNLAATCAALLAGGWLTEHVLTPALADGGAWSTTIGAWVGTGPGRGLAFLFIVCGAGSCVVSLLGLARGSLRRLDDRLDDGLAMDRQPLTDRSYS